MCSDLLLLAYIDPGTGGMIVGWLGVVISWALIALVFVRRHVAAALKAIAWFLFDRRRAALTVAVLALLSGLGISFPRASLEEKVVNPAHPTNRAQRVLAIGIDGADPEVVGALMAGGHLPHMKAMADQGGFKSLGIPNPAQSPVVWAALATGQNPGRNGIYDFITRDASSYQPRLSLLEASRGTGGYKYPIRAKAFWDVTTAHGMAATIIRWPMTFPPPAINGRMLAGLGVPDVRGALGRYTFYTDEPKRAEPGADGEGGGSVVSIKVAEGGRFTTELAGPQVRGLAGVKTVTTPIEGVIDGARGTVQLSLGGKTFTLEQGKWSDLIELKFESGLFSKYRAQVRLYLLSAQTPLSLLATSVEMTAADPVTPFTSPKSYASELSAAIGPFHTLGMPEDVKAYGNGHLDEKGFLSLCDAVEKERRAMLMHELARFDRGVLAVVFDTLDRIQHMTPYADDLPTSPMGRYLIDFDVFLGTVLAKLPPGTEVVIFSDHGFSEFRRAVDLNRWLASQGELSLDAARETAKKPGSNGELYAFVDWSKTQAYAVGFAGIFVNVTGREGKGIVAEAQRREVAERIKQKLEGLTDPEDGARVIHRIYHRDELYSGAALNDAPDLVIGYRPGYRGSWQSAIGGVAEHVISPNEKKWQRDHIVDASFVSGILLTSFAIRAEQPHAYDLAPTLLSLLGLPPLPEMEGRPFNEAREGDTPSVSAGTYGKPSVRASP